MIRIDRPLEEGTLGEKFNDYEGNLKQLDEMIMKFPTVIVI